MFDAISTAGTGINVMQTWIDALGNNIANINDVSPTSGPAFQASFVQAQALPTGADGLGGGVKVTALPLGSANGRLAYEPENPIADAQGYVRHPDIDLSQQMGDLIMAQRAYQANASVVNRAKDMYDAGIAIGKGMQ
ncbi:MAG TPA: flagellar basal body rod C-terminal domain-containing protein [Jatrophihabitans sp.]|jgi:flagellar basal-body rod protein FlgC